MADAAWRPMRTPGHFISRVHRAMTRIGDARLKELGFATAQLPVLGALHGGEKRSQTDLAHLAKVEQPTMAQLLARMERDGLIARAPDPHDRRSSLVSLTAQARERLPAGRKILLQGNRDMTRGLSDEEVETLVSLLEHVLANAEALGGQGMRNPRTLLIAAATISNQAQGRPDRDLPTIPVREIDCSLAEETHITP